MGVSEQAAFFQSSHFTVASLPCALTELLPNMGPRRPVLMHGWGEQVGGVCVRVCREARAIWRGTTSARR